MKKLLIQLFTILYIVFNTSAIAGVTPGGEGEFEVDESSMLGFWGNVLTRDGPSGVYFKGKWKASVLVGEPLKVVGMKWQVGNSVRYDGSIYSTDGSLEQCNYIPQSVINNIEIIDLEIVGTIANPWTDEAFLFINADAMFKPGNNGNWGKTNLTLPASPDWENFLYSSPYSTSLPWSSVSEEDAKNIMRDGFIMEDITISKLSFNMTPVRLWLLKNECEEEEKIQEALTGSRYSLEEREQLESEDTGTSLLDDVTNLWDEFTAEETDFESDVASVDEYREDLSQQKVEVENASKQTNTKEPTQFHFYFYFQNKKSERRDWIKKQGRWEEIYPNGSKAQFIILGRTDAPGMPGQLLRREPDNGQRLFIPDKGNKQMRLGLKNSGGDWFFFANMLNVR